MCVLIKSVFLAPIVKDWGLPVGGNHNRRYREQLGSTGLNLIPVKRQHLRLEIFGRVPLGV